MALLDVQHHILCTPGNEHKSTNIVVVIINQHSRVEPNSFEIGIWDTFTRNGQESFTLTAFGKLWTAQGTRCSKDRERINVNIRREEGYFLKLTFISPLTFDMQNTP